MAKRKFSVSRKKTTPRKPLWKLEDGITYSSLSLWDQCPEQFSLQYIDGLSQKKLSIALEFGSVMHYALENQFKATPEEVIRRITDHYRKYRSASLRNSRERDDLNYLLGLAEIVFPRYCHYWQADDSQIEWIMREQKFDQVYRFPGISEEKSIRLRGMIDGLFTYKNNPNTFGVFETKTKVKIDDKDIMDNLQYDMQTMMYCLCAYLKTGVYPNTIKYNVIRRPDLYRRKDETHNSYMQRVAEDIDKRPDHYFIRYNNTAILQDDIDKFARCTLNPILNLFLQWEESTVKKNLEDRFQSPYHFLNSSALVGKYGKVAMWDAIFGDMQPYKVRTQVFPELEESFQVTWD